MRSLFTLLAVSSTILLPAVASADSIQGSYVEARLLADSLASQGGRLNDMPAQAVLAWQVRHGTYDGENLDGQTIVAVVTTEPSTGGSIGETKTILFVDGRTTACQERALVHLAKDLAPKVVLDVSELRRSKLDVRIAEGCGRGAAVVECSMAQFQTRRLTDAEVAVVDSCEPKQPLGDVFSSTTAVITGYAFDGEPVPVGNVLNVCVGSFSR